MFRELIALGLLLIVSVSARCRRPFELTEEFCKNVPTTPVDIEAFKGVWYQLFLPVDDRFQINSCATAEYTPRNGEILNLECEFADFLTRPRCVRDIITRRTGGGPGSFVVTSGPEEASFDVVAFLGSKSFGYFGAALFQCSSNPRKVGYFILARAPLFHRIVLKRLRRKLKCLGFPVPSRKVINRTPHVRCKYFFNQDGFDILTPPNF